MKSDRQKEYREKAESLFGGVEWLRKERKLYIAKERLVQSKSKNERAKYEKEIAQARILTARRHTVYLVPESGNGKHYDALVDGRETEMKTLTGGVNAVGRNFAKAIKQGKDVFLCILNENVSLGEIAAVLVKKIRVMSDNGAVFKDDSIVRVWVEKEKKLTNWKLQELIKASKGQQQQTPPKRGLPSI